MLFWDHGYCKRVKDEEPKKARVRQNTGPSVGLREKCLANPAEKRRGGGFLQVKIKTTCLCSPTENKQNIKMLKFLELKLPNFQFMFSGRY